MMRSILTIAILAVAVSARAEAYDAHDQDKSGQSFVGKSLNKANFSGATLTNCDFSQATLRGADFSNSVLSNAKFYEADATNADFSGASATNLRFGKVTLNSAKLHDLDKVVLSFDDCKLIEANLQNTKITHLFASDLSRADLRGANLRVAFSIGNPALVPRFNKALYNDDTAFPDGFDPKAAGMIFKEADKTDDKKTDKTDKTDTKKDEKKKEDK